MDGAPALRRDIESRVERLERCGLRVTCLQVVLSVEKLQHKDEVVGTVNGKRVQAKTATREMYATIDALIDRVDAQFRKCKERLADHKPGRVKPLREAGPPPKWGQQDGAAVERQPVPVLSLAQAHKQFRAESTQPFMVFVNAENGRFQLVQRTPTGRVTVVEPYAEEGARLASH